MLVGQGHYGPRVQRRRSELKLTFSANPCHNNPLYDPQCQGYATALFNAHRTHCLCTQPIVCTILLVQLSADRCLYDPIL